MFTASSDDKLEIFTTSDDIIRYAQNIDPHAGVKSGDLHTALAVLFLRGFDVLRTYMDDTQNSQTVERSL